MTDTCTRSTPRTPNVASRSGRAPVFALLPRSDYSAPFDLNLRVTPLDSDETRTLTLRFRGP